MSRAIKSQNIRGMHRHNILLRQGLLQRAQSCARSLKIKSVKENLLWSKIHCYLPYSSRTPQLNTWDSSRLPYVIWKQKPDSPQYLETSYSVRCRRAIGTIPLVICPPRTLAAPGTYSVQHPTTRQGCSWVDSGGDGRPSGPEWVFHGLLLYPPACCQNQPLDVQPFVSQTGLCRNLWVDRRSESKAR